MGRKPQIHAMQLCCQRKFRKQNFSYKNSDPQGHVSAWCIYEMHKGPRVSISSGVRGVRRWCRRRGRDSSEARIRSNRKFHPLYGGQQRSSATYSTGCRASGFTESYKTPDYCFETSERVPSLSLSQVRWGRNSTGVEWGDAVAEVGG